jgi:hypothetical protein
MGMPWKPGQILVGVVVAEIVEEEKGIVIRGIAEPEGATQFDAGALESGFGLRNMLDGPDRHGELLFVRFVRVYAPNAGVHG